MRCPRLSNYCLNALTSNRFINSQLRLEAEAREALPYVSIIFLLLSDVILTLPSQKIDTCTKDLGPLRQLLFSCLTCNPPPANDTDLYTPAAVCYSCSVSCHGEHILVELFNKRNFVCDCGTTRLPFTAPCTLRANEKGEKGVTGEAPVKSNEYNQNFRNKFCGCRGDYDAEEESSTMYQCLGLKGGCGEDWWHSTCVVGLDRSWYEQAMMDKIKEVMEEQAKKAEEAEKATEGTENTATLAVDAVSDAGTEEDPVPPGFPSDNDFEAFLCYKCVEANPWIKKYAGTTGFLEPVFVRSKAPSPEEPKPSERDALVKKSDLDGVKTDPEDDANEIKRKQQKKDPYEQLTGDKNESAGARERREPEEEARLIKADEEAAKTEEVSKKRKAAEDELQEVVKKAKTGETPAAPTSSCIASTLPTPPAEPFSLFLKEDFRDHLCRCKVCFPLLTQNPCLLEEEDTYEPPVSEPSEAGSSAGSLFDRGEKVLNSMDRVKAIEGVMAFNKLKEKLTPFFKEFAESGKAISAEDIKEHFAKMRGDDSGKPKDEEEAA